MWALKGKLLITIIAVIYRGFSLLVHLMKVLVLEEYISLLVHLMKVLVLEEHITIFAIICRGFGLVVLLLILSSVKGLCHTILLHLAEEVMAPLVGLLNLKGICSILTARQANQFRKRVILFNWKAGRF